MLGSELVQHVHPIVLSVVANGKFVGKNVSKNQMLPIFERFKHQWLIGTQFPYRIQHTPIYPAFSHCFALARWMFCFLRWPCCDMFVKSNVVGFVDSMSSPERNIFCYFISTWPVPPEDLTNCEKQSEYVRACHMEWFIPFIFRQSDAQSFLHGM